MYRLIVNVTMSRGTKALQLSGIIGIVMGALIGNIQFAYRSPMMFGGAQASPEGLVATHVHILGLSLIVLVIATFFDDAILGYRDLTAALLIIGQWAEPASIYGVAMLEIGPAGLTGQLAALLNFLLYLAIALNYLRRWGAIQH